MKKELNFKVLLEDGCANVIGRAVL